MKRIFLTIALALVCILTSAQTKKVVTDSVAFMPNQVQIFEGLTKNGNPKWWIELPTENGTRKVTMTESHAKSGRLLALIERRDEETGKYTYSIKFAESRRGGSDTGKANLNGLR